MIQASHFISAAAQPLSPWLQEVAQRRVSLAHPSQNARTQGVVQRAFDWIIHLFLYHFNLNQQYCTFYDILRVNPFTLVNTHPPQDSTSLDPEEQLLPLNEQSSSPLPTPPIGFRNYGNSCWLASSMQIFLAMPWFEEQVRMPLEQENDETDQIFQARQEVQNALIAIIDLKKQSGCNSNTMSAALKTLHERIRPFEDAFSAIGGPGNAEIVIPTIAKIFNFNLGYGCYFERRLEKNENITLYGTSAHLVMESGLYTFQSNDASKIINISFGDGTTCQYRVAGFIKHITLGGEVNHAISYVSVGGRWYCCNDSIITPLESIQGISVTHDNPIILERVEL